MILRKTVKIIRGVSLPCLFTKKNTMKKLFLLAILFASVSCCYSQTIPHDTRRYGRCGYETEADATIERNMAKKYYFFPNADETMTTDVIYYNAYSGEWCYLMVITCNYPINIKPQDENKCFAVKQQPVPTDY